jgi:hypothetical protein
LRKEGGGRELQGAARLKRAQNRSVRVRIKVIMWAKLVRDQIQKDEEWKPD